MLAHRLDCRRQVSGHIRLNYVASGPRTERLAHHLGRIVLRQDQNFRIWNVLPDPTACFQTVHPRHTDVKNDDIRFQATGLIHGFNSVLRFINNLPTGVTAK